MATKHATCFGHVKLECGCRLCAVPGMNADKKGVISPADLRKTERFHAWVHKTEAARKRAEAKRPKPLVTAKAARIKPASMIPTSRFHRHTASCTIPLEGGQVGYKPKLPMLFAGDARYVLIGDKPKHPIVALTQCTKLGIPIPAKRVPKTVLAAASIAAKERRERESTYYADERNRQEGGKRRRR